MLVPFQLAFVPQVGREILQSAVFQDRESFRKQESVEREFAGVNFIIAIL
jgi:hypothetical protein